MLCVCGLHEHDAPLYSRVNMSHICHCSAQKILIETIMKFAKDDHTLSLGCMIHSRICVQFEVQQRTPMFLTNAWKVLRLCVCARSVKCAETRAAERKRELPVAQRGRSSHLTLGIDMRCCASHSNEPHQLQWRKAKQINDCSHMAISFSKLLRIFYFFSTNAI